MKPLKEKKPFQAPHTFVILVVLILLAVAATYVVLPESIPDTRMRRQTEPLWKRGASIMLNLTR